MRAKQPTLYPVLEQSILKVSLAKGFYPLLHVKPQHAPGGFLDLHQKHHWCNSKNPHEGLAILGSKDMAGASFADPTLLGPELFPNLI